MARRLFALAALTYGLAWLAWWRWPKFQESPLGWFVGIPPFSVYVFEHFGVPGLTDPTNCDWMWCKPTIFGVIFTTAVWLCAAWLVSHGIARLTERVRRPPDAPSGHSLIPSCPPSGVP